jgi:hypothetical protein
MKDYNNRITKLEDAIKNILNPAQINFKIYEMEGGIEKLKGEYSVPNKDQKYDRNIKIIFAHYGDL